MGQKIDPRGYRLAVTKNWSSRWFAHSKDFANILIEDIKIRQYIMKKYGRRAAIARVLIERPTKNMKVTIFSAKPGILIGKKGEGIEQLKLELQKLTQVTLHLNIEEIRKPELSAQIVADQVAQQIEKRIAFRRAMKRAIQATLKVGAIGIKIMASGRLNGVDIARREWYREGKVPLHTLRADIDYATMEAHTTFGIIGIKVWIYKGDLKLHNIKTIHTQNESGVDKVKQDKLNDKKPYNNKRPPAARQKKTGVENATTK